MDESKKDLYLEALSDLKAIHIDTQSKIASLDKKVDLHIQKTEYELAHINELDQYQNKLLDQHIEGVNTLKKWCDLHEKKNNEKFEELEKPHIWMNGTIKLVTLIGAGAAAAYYVGKLMGKL